MDLRIPHVEQRLRDGMGELKSVEDDGNDLEIFMAEIVKEEEHFQEKRSLIEVGRKYSVPPDIFPQNFKETIFDSDSRKDKMSLLKQVEPHLHLIDISQRNDRLSAASTNSYSEYEFVLI